MSQIPTDLIGISAAAKALKLAPSLVSRAVKAGAIPNYAKSGTPRISLAEARQLREANTDQRRRPLTGPGGSSPSNGTLLEYRTSSEEARAKSAQIDLAERLGQTISREDADDATATAARALRDALSRRWRVLAAAMAGKSAREIEALGAASDADALAELVRKLETDADAPAAAA